VQQTEEYMAKQRELIKDRAKAAHVIITTAQIRGRKAPIIIPKTTVDEMQQGAVIIDLAASTGGNCEMTQDQKTIVYNGVTIMGDSELADTMPQDASFLYANNVLNFLKVVVVDGAIQPDPENEIVKSAWITQ
jgi:NAD(P) transhydrogenase subunit alpha